MYAYTTMAYFIISGTAVGLVVLIVEVTLSLKHLSLNMSALPSFPEDVAIGALAAGDVRTVERQVSRVARHRYDLVRMSIDDAGK